MSIANAAHCSMMGGGKSSILPPGARWVEYLESTGTQWIDTGRGLTGSSKIVLSNVVFTYTSYGKFIFGSGGSGKGGYSLVIEGGAQLNVCFGRKYFAKYGVTSQFNITCDIRKMEIIFSGITTRVTGSDVPSGKNIALFSNTKGENPSLCHIGKYDFYDNEVLIQSLRPIAIGTTGYMIDLLTGDYLQYGNKGTGDFVIGPDIATPAA